MLAAVSGEVTNYTDAAPEAPPLIAFDEKEQAALQNAISVMQQVQAANAEREAIAGNAFQALLWQLANKHEVDMKNYVLDLDKGGFVKK